MKKLQRKQKTRRIIYSLPFLVILLVVTLFFVKGAIRVLDRERVSARFTKDLETRAAELSQREVELEKKLAELKTEEGLKAQIRDKFNVVEEGEQVALIVDERSTSSALIGSDLPWYRRFWNVIVRNK